MLLYYFFKFIVRIVLWAWYGKRYLHGFENIPKSGPVIFACNHPNSFLDAMIIGAWIDREVHFLTRSDVFNTPLKLWILSKFKMIPIYRLQEGVENLDKNKDTFDRCQKIFKAGGAVLIFSEGLCIQELRLRPLKKGTARIAMEYSKDGAPLMIIPTGLNYLRANKFRQSIYISMGQPFNAADFANEYNDNQAKGIIAFNKTLDAELHKVVIHIHDKANEPNIATLLNVHSNNKGANAFSDLINVPSRLDALSRENPERYAAVIEKLSAYKTALKKYDADDRAVANSSGSSLAVVIAWLTYIPGWLIFLPITTLINHLAKTKVRRVEFYDSVLLGGATLLYFPYLLIIAIVAISINAVVGIAIVATISILGLLAVKSFDVIKLTNHGAFKARAGKEAEVIMKLRNEISSLPRFAEQVGE